MLQATWIALTGRYPMAFDEDFHLGIIRLYAHHISPFWASQPSGADAYGAVARDPSYLYQYLMSFPYRLISAFTHDQTLQVLFLRAINIILFAVSLPLWRRLLQKTGASRAIIHGCLIIFVLIPVVPLLAAQINYDNLLIPLTALVLLLTVTLSEKMVRRKPLNIQLSLIILILCLLTSLVKYAFLPIFAAIILFIVIRLWQVYGSPHELLKSLRLGTQYVKHRIFLLLGCLVILSGGLFLQRYAVNVIRYHQIIPDCQQVLSINRCHSYGPWDRDYSDSLTKADNDKDATHFVFYIGDWFYGMWLRTFFAVDGPATNYETRGPFIVPSMAAIGFASVGLIALVVTRRRLLARYHSSVLLFFLLVSVVYTLALWLDEYKSYVATGQPVAINGRYLIPVLPLVLVLLAIAYGELLRRYFRAKVALACLAIVSLLWGGGALTYILRSNYTWYWPARPVYSVNHAVQDVIGPLTPGYNSPDQFLH